MFHSISGSYYSLLILPPPPSVPFNINSLLSSYHPLPTSYSRVVRRSPPPDIPCRLFIFTAQSAWFFRHVLSQFSLPFRPSYIVSPFISLMYPPISLPVLFSVSFHILVFGFCSGGLIRMQRKGALVHELPVSLSTHSLTYPSTRSCRLQDSCFNWVLSF